MREWPAPEPTPATHTVSQATTAYRNPAALPFVTPFVQAQLVCIGGRKVFPVEVHYPQPCQAIPSVYPRDTVAPYGEARTPRHGLRP